ncbi:uncharacterized protein RB166_010973 [Leptodactylus fuscus]
MADLCLPVTGLLAMLVLRVLLPDPAGATGCSRDQYEEVSDGKVVCCDFCAAELKAGPILRVIGAEWIRSPHRGQQILDICTSSNKASKCGACRNDYYNPRNARDGCKKCTKCEADEGSITLKPCTIEFDAVCGCPEGSTKKNNRYTACRCDSGNEIINNKCQPCKPGTFSDKENSKCLPWTNCTAMGQAVTEQGSATRDVKCAKPFPSQVTVAVPTTSLSPSSSSLLRKVTILQNITTKSRTLSLILIGAILLLLSAGVILAMIIQINRKKMNRGFIRAERCRIPVQEESTSSDSSLPKDCQA